MNVQNLLSHDLNPHQRLDLVRGDVSQEAHRAHQYPTRHSAVYSNNAQNFQQYATPEGSPTYAMQPINQFDGYNGSPTKMDPKNITFELLFNSDARYRGRLPMKVQIFPHDNTDGIVSTVKNFFGLYDEALAGVSFEDSNGNTLIASHENFANGMTVFVRVIPKLPEYRTDHEATSERQQAPLKIERTPHLDEGFQMPPPHLNATYHHPQPASRPASRLARRQSSSPKIAALQHHSSTQKSRPRPTLKRDSREGSFQARLEELNSDAVKACNSSDGDAASVTSSFRARNEGLASAEISQVNIVEGGRRQKAKFESSELPLFVPPQVPVANSISSISPQRRSNGNENASPFAHPLQRPASWYHPMPSPQNSAFGSSGLNTNPARAPEPPHGHRLRDRVNAPTMPTYMRGGMASKGIGYGILPTPDPTIASTISDEDVALQLMRLGDPSNISHGRTSASTMDDALSGRADIASSGTSDEEGELDVDQPTMQTGSPNEAGHNAHQRSAGMAISDFSGDEEYQDDGPASKRQKVSVAKTPSSKPRTNSGSKKSSSSKIAKPRLHGQIKKLKHSLGSNTPKVPISPASLPPQSRKGSTASIMGPPQLPFPDELDLSTKPRCQRCRKSKKGCDRQRPCQRCKDAGIGIEGCVSEDEGNGRKGRFGRHMGVNVQSDVQAASEFENDDLSLAIDGDDNSKKRKR
ncbi:uncharacterized protein KY384_004759 [Bacidia gigantensis]|uniref:uncharacterized protein n=1 Tax=Bacidia gigantensis TaxID=2732470 RepID=UPI001D0593A9|nr:uncharacterized protein KY384_004759 [Bacidia gigantensis]KAG8530258.1 hypothetical protein KY384_004759 [Bacidia gigantensis]